MSDSAAVNQSSDDWMDAMMFASHTMNFWFPLYHYMKMGGSFAELSIYKWVSTGVPKKYIAPPEEFEVMNDMDSFHEFRQKMITHLYNEYVEGWESDPGE